MARLAPTDQQLEVIEHDDGRAVVFAVAGSGKTSTMAWRVERLVKQRGIEGSRIVATTFSRFARDQMRNKFDELGISSSVHTLTLHQFASRVIRLAERKIGFMPRVEIGDDAKQRDTLKRAKEQFLGDSTGIQDEGVRRQLMDLSREDFFDILGKMKGNLCFTEGCFSKLPEALQQLSTVRTFDNRARWLESLIDTYETLRANDRFRGFDDMLVDALEAVYCNQIMRAEISGKFDYIMVDEYQDINKSQDALVQICDEKRGNLMVIGDDDQTIYEWRGATPAFIREKVTSNSWSHYFLDLNFRSCAPQVILASQCIKMNRLRAAKKMQPTGDFSGEFTLEKCSSNEEQAKKIVCMIREKVDAGVPLGDQVVLIRRYAQSLSLEKELIQNKIKYRVPGAAFYFDRKEVQFVIGFFRLFELEQQRLSGQRMMRAVDVREYSSLLNQVAYRARTFLKTKTQLRQILDSAMQDGFSLSSSIHQFLATQEKDYPNAVALAQFFKRSEDSAPVSSRELLSLLQRTIDIRQRIIDDAPEREIGLERIGVLEGLSSFVGDKTTTELLDEIDELTEYWQNGLREEDDKNILRIYTIFKAKGLEFPVVYIPDVHRSNQGAQHGTSPLLREEVGSSVEEERRIFYVAVTRAIRDLHLFYWQEPSEYLEEAKIDQILEYQSIARDVAVGGNSLDMHDSRRLGRWFSALSYKYETKSSFANIFARAPVDAVQSTLSRLYESIDDLKQDPGLTVKDIWNYETLREFWRDSGAFAARLRSQLETLENLSQKAIIAAPMSGATVAEPDPFDEVFRDA